MKQLLSLVFVGILFLAGAVPVGAANDFTAEYFSNKTLAGSPIVTRTESEINNDWGVTSPDPGLPVDSFSARWTGDFDFEAGQYTFSVTADDGVRLWVDGQVVIDQWKDQAPTTIQTTRTLTAGSHAIKLEYYEAGGGATAVLVWSKVTQSELPQTLVMPLGDSITDGWTVPGGYRTELKNLVPNINLVGSLQNGPAQLLDRDHEGHSGWRIDEIQNNVVSWLNTHSPQTVLLLIGTNDMIGNHQVATAPQRLSTLVDTITQTKPDANVLVASLPPLGTAAEQQRVDAYNQAIPAMIEQKRSQGKKVHYVDMHTAITLADMPDGRHPNAAGYMKMAQKWASALATVAGGSSPEIPTDPEPEPEPVPNPGTGDIAATYFSNMTLSGTPVLSRNETAVNYDWAAGSPHASVPNDNFSARWTTSPTLEAGTYRFTVVADDGVRLKVDGQTVIDKWINQGPTTYTADVVVTAGAHPVQMEYFENGGGAVAKLSWLKIANQTPVEPPVEPGPPSEIPQDNGFRAQYFNNTSLTGTPVLTRSEAQINNNWSSGSPHASVNADFFSARWEGNYTFAQGTYKFTVRADDGVRLKIDNQTVIDKWIDQGPTTYTVDVAFSGSKKITLEYYEKQGGATAELSWAAVNQPPVNPTPVEPGVFQAQYFNNFGMTDTPVLTRNETTLNYDWGAGSPHASVPVDNFSARWTKLQTLVAGTYRFSVTADDGVRVKVDGQTIIDKWVDQGPTTYIRDIQLTQGDHTIVIEYYERGGGAVLKHSLLKL